MTSLSNGSAESQLVVLLDDDPGVTEGLAAGLERDGRTVITCNDVESAELIVRRMKPSHIVADIRLSGPFAFEGLDFIQYAKRHAPESCIILISGDGSHALQLEASRRGAVGYLQKPFAVQDLDAALNLIAGSIVSPLGEYGPLIRMPLLDDILGSEDFRPLLQPIVRLGGDRSVIGYEALACLRSQSPLRDPDLLREYALRKQRLADLELACMQKALGYAASLDALIFLNAHPRLFAPDMRLCEMLRSYAEKAGVGLDRIVLEITEQGSLDGSPAALRTIEELRGFGIRFAFDDIGLTDSHLPLIASVRPSFLKIGRRFGTSFETDSTRMKIVMTLLALANDFNCDLILEGIEHEATAFVAAGLGIPLGQGSLFGPPVDRSAGAPPS